MGPCFNARFLEDKGLPGELWESSGLAKVFANSTAKDVRLLPGGKFEVTKERGEVDTAEEEVLVDFVREVVGRSPGRKTALILVDHGAGYEKNSDQQKFLSVTRSVTPWHM
eukprot:8328803-Pyramimonas_sp.AAC.1